MGDAAPAAPQMPPISKLLPLFVMMGM